MKEFYRLCEWGFLVAALLGAVGAHASTVTVWTSPGAIASETVLARPGDAVRWVGSGDAHTLSSGAPGEGAGELFSAELGGSEPVFSYAFAEPGDYDYFIYSATEGYHYGVVQVQASEFLFPGPQPLNSNYAGTGGVDASVKLATDGNGVWLAVWESTETLGGNDWERLRRVVVPVGG